ncbi:MAG TPA: DNA primase small subunit domain-containing protein [Candidatus Nitrosocosmicus sp.]|nr:DNA primase small subunit domain-containing protein [Candidatus Nitrosocosmicus sp.]
MEDVRDNMTSPSSSSSSTSSSSSSSDRLKDPLSDSFTYPQSNENDPNKIWLQKVFRKHYFNSSSEIELDDYVSEHEFGFRLFDGHVRRHLNFKNKRELIASIIKFSPSDIFCSPARYQYPSANMDQKGWIGADLIFDIDGKDLELDCARIHNMTFCKNCKLIEKEVHTSCSRCNSSMVNIIELPCQNCIKNLKMEVTKLVEVLHDDFGIEQTNINIFFSGNNGFHVHVVDDNFFKSNSMKRSSLTQYLLGRGYLIDNLGFRIDKSNNITMLPNKVYYNRGWRARLLNQLHLQLKNHRIDDKFIRKIAQIKETNKLGISEIIHNEIQNISVKIDPNVTIDIHRIFRLAGTINSKSGLLKCRCKNLISFDPFIESCIREDSLVKINAIVDTKTIFNGTSYKIKTGINNIPEFVAVYLVSKGLGDIYIEN